MALFKAHVNATLGSASLSLDSALSDPKINKVGIYLYLLFYPTDPFTILEPRHREIDEFCVVQESRATDFEDSKL